MRIRGCILALLTIIFFGRSLTAGGLSGETEIGANGRGDQFAHQYLFYDFEKTGFLFRYFKNDFLNRAEFAFGPTIKKRGGVFKFQFGGTTDRDAMAAVVIAAPVCGRQLFYIGDGKISTTQRPDTLYQKLFVEITPGSPWNFRVEDLHIAGRQEFLRLGIEYRLNLRDSQFFFAPFYDSAGKGVGGQLGFRF